MSGKSKSKVLMAARCLLGKVLKNSLPTAVVVAFQVQVDLQIIGVDKAAQESFQVE